MFVKYLNAFILHSRKVREFRALKLMQMTEIGSSRFSLFFVDGANNFDIFKDGINFRIFFFISDA